MVLLQIIGDGLHGAGVFHTVKLPRVDHHAFPDIGFAHGCRIQILVRGFHDTDVVGEGTTRVTLKPSTQVKATVIVSGGRLPDGDSDGVPDEIDNCPDYINATQGPCNVDGGVDAAAGDSDVGVPVGDGDLAG